MNGFLENIFSKASTGNYLETISQITKYRDSPETLSEIYTLLINGRFLEAYVLANLLRGVGGQNPVLPLAISIGGFLFGNASDEAEGVSALSASMDSLSAENQTLFSRRGVHPAISRLITADNSLVRDHGRTLRVLEIYKAGFPLFRSIFDWSDTAPPLNLDELRRQGRERARLIDFSGPPAGASRKGLRAIVALRERIFPGNPNSRLYDMGPRMAAAMNSYGWRASHFGMSFQNHLKDYADIVAVCEQDKADMLFLDDYPVLSESIHPARASMIAALRQKLPGLKIVSIHLDPWQIEPATMIKTCAPIDAVWTPFPCYEVWNHPAFANKLVTVQWPQAGNGSAPVTPLSSSMTFTGGVFGYNWHRAFWLAAVQHGFPFQFQMSTHMEDGLSVLDSYADYLKRIEGSGCSLNFSMRPDLSCVMTARSFETIIAGGLLVQEDAPELDYYFVSGEHYLRFSTAPELRAIARFIAEKPDEAEDIRRRGSLFAREHYSDEKLIGSLEKQIYFREDHLATA